MRKELESRLLGFSIEIMKLCKRMRNDVISQHMANQISRLSTSAALNYGEVQGAESRKDFIHKSSIVLKELRETHINLQIISGSGLIEERMNIDKLIDENNQMVAIFHKTVITAKSNRKQSNR